MTIELGLDYESFNPASGGNITSAYSSATGYIVKAHCMVTDAGWREFLNTHRGFDIHFDAVTRANLIRVGFELATN